MRNKALIIPLPTAYITACLWFVSLTEMPSALRISAKRYMTFGLAVWQRI